MTDPSRDMLADAVNTICDRLEDRTAAVFLGAGINGGVERPDGIRFPLGNDLAQAISRDLLNNDDPYAILDDVADIARYKYGDSELNRYIYDLFTTFRPISTHDLVVQLPWDIIYTTNYDLLIESSASSINGKGAGSIRPIYSSHDESSDIARLSEDDIPYVKLHGSIDHANSSYGRIVITKEDYRHYEKYRAPLFKRLTRDLLNRTIVFVGYSLSDSNFRSLLDDARRELDIESFPISFAVQRSFTSERETYWREKYNIQLLSSDSKEFFELLFSTWRAQNRIVTPFSKRKSSEYLQVDTGSRFQIAGESFAVIDPQRITGTSNSSRFFRGGEPTWPDIRDNIPAERDEYWTLYEGLYHDLTDPISSPTTYLVTGAAGTGKTTLIRSIAFDIAKSLNSPVLEHIYGTPLDPRALRPMITDENPKRIVVLIRHAASQIRQIERFIDECFTLSLPVSIVLEERRNQWRVFSSFSDFRRPPTEIELGPLSEEEIDRILAALKKHRSLEKLSGTDIDYQRQHFRLLANHDLLVSLRELTSQTRFDEIIRDEFDNIPSNLAQRAYTFVAAVGQIDVALRYELLIRILKISYADLAKEIFQPTESILISTEQTGNSRHNSGFRVAARHPVVASIIFGSTASSDDDKMEIINTILTELEPGVREDRHLLTEIARRRELIGTIASHDRRRSIFQRLSALLPDDAFILRHRSILERDLGNAESAVRFARESLRISPNSPASLNTLGLALEYSARDETDRFKWRGLIREAEEVFDSGIQRDKSDAFGYLGKCYVLRQYADREPDSSKRAYLKAETLTMLDEAYELTDRSDVIAVVLAEERDRLGSSDEAISILRAAIKDAPASSRMRDVLIRLLTVAGSIDEALKTTVDGIAIDPNSWRLQRHMARLLARSDGTFEAVKGHYDAAIRHNRGDLSLLVELASYLFQKRAYGDAATAFGQAKTLPLPASEKSRIRVRWQDSAGRERDFAGTVKRIRGLVAEVTAVPDNFVAEAWIRNRDLDIRYGDHVRFRVGFNAYGAQALGLEKIQGGA